MNQIGIELVKFLWNSGVEMHDIAKRLRLPVSVVEGVIKVKKYAGHTFEKKG